MTIGDAKHFLSPIRPIASNRGSAVPVGANEDYMVNVDRQFITGITNQEIPTSISGGTSPSVVNKYAGPNQYEIHKNNYYNNIQFPVYDVTKLCSSWAPAVTSAMSISVSRWAGKFINFSLQYVLDCDIIGDSCIERPPLNAYQLFWTYHPPTNDSWDVPGQNSERLKPTDSPRSDFTTDNCKDNSCYPGHTCVHNWALTGSCHPSDPQTMCPIHFLYNWRWIKSHLWEVGAVTSSILVYTDLFTYKSGVYSHTNAYNLPIGMLDVTIIGWGQQYLNLSAKDKTNTQSTMRWWYVIPHLGEFHSEDNTMFFEAQGTKTSPLSILQYGNYVFDASKLKSNVNLKKALIKINRRFDECSIETHAVGAVPFNFIPHPARTPNSRT